MKKDVRSSRVASWRSQRGFAFATVLAAACLISACSSSNGSTSGTGSTAGSGSPSQSRTVANAKALIAKYSVQPAFTAPGPKLDAKSLAGKTIAVVAIDMRVPALAEVAQYIQQVAHEIGLKATVFDGQSNPSLVQQGLNQAITSKVGAIVSLGLPVQLIGSSIAAAKAKGIPTVDVINTPPKVGVPGEGSDPSVFGNVAPDYTVVGQLLAATAIVDANGRADVSIMNTSELTAAPALVQGMKSEITTCSGCSLVSTTDTALADWSTQLTGRADTTIRSNPQVNFLLPIYDNMAIYATSGVQQAGATGKVKIASFDGTAAALALVKQGNIFVADPMQSTDWAAWAAVDQAMRGMLKMAPANPILPIRYVNTAELKNVNVSTAGSVSSALFGTDFQAGYRALWGLSS